MVRVDLLSNGHMSFGLMTRISAKDAVCIPHVHMLAILEHQGNVTLYSGMTCVGKLHIDGTLVQHAPSPFVRRKLPQFTSYLSPYPRRSSLLPHCSSGSDPKFDEHLLSPVLPPGAPLTKNTNFLQVQLPFTQTEQPDSTFHTHLSGLRDAIENRISLQYSDGSCYRITLPYLATSPLVEGCLGVLRQCLPRDSVLTLFVRWYSIRNSLGTSEVNVDQEWDMFVNLIYELLGYEDDQISEMSKECPVTPSCAAKRAKQSNSGTNDDWTYLKNSEYKNTLPSLFQVLQIDEKIDNSPNMPSNILENGDVHINTNAILFPFIKFIHYSLHLLYEDYKLNTLKNDLLPKLVQLLSKLANDLHLENYAIFYWKDFPNLCTVKKQNGISLNDLKNVNTWNVSYEKVTSIMEHLFCLIKGEEPVPYSYLKNVNKRSRDIIQLMEILSSHNKEVTINTIHSLSIEVEKMESDDFSNINVLTTSKVEEVVLLMKHLKFTTKTMETLPFGIYLYLYGALWQCRENPPADWTAEAYYLIWREDLATQAIKTKKDKTDTGIYKYGMYSRSQLQEAKPSLKQVDWDLADDGMEDVDNPLMQLRFPDDIRVSETRKMLQSSKPVPIYLTQRPDVSDHDFIEEQEKHLYAICTRTMSLPIGRGMFTLRTATPVITDPLPSPQLCLLGKSADRGTTVDLNHIDTPSNMNLWPLFHNGVASGLRITPDAHNIDNTWIIFNKPKGGLDRL